MRPAEGWKVRKGLARRYERGQLVEARTVDWLCAQVVAGYLLDREAVLRWIFLDGPVLAAHGQS